MCFKVSPAAQILAFQRYNKWWSVNVRKVKRTARARLRWTEDYWAKSIDHACMLVWTREEAKKDARAPRPKLHNRCRRQVTTDMLEAMTAAFLCGWLDNALR